jgi:hypothetical protein
MKSFNYNEEWEPQYVTNRSDPKWREVYSFVRRDYWHSTTPQHWDAIRQSGAIMPNRNRQFPSYWKGVVADHCYSIKHECIALFDFVTPTEEEIMRVWDRAWEVITFNARQVAVLLQIERQRLEDRIIPNGRASHDEGHVPFCEVWYPDDIPIDAISGVYRLPLQENFGELNPERIALGEHVEPEQRTYGLPPNCEGWTPKQAFEWLVRNADAQPIPPAIRELLGDDFFTRDDSSDEFGVDMPI